MIPRTPRSTRTDTLFPYTTLFRSFFRMSAAARSMDSSCEASKASRVRRLLPNCSDWVLRRLINGMFKGQQWRYTPLSVYRNRVLIQAYSRTADGGLESSLAGLRRSAGESIDERDRKSTRLNSS